MQIPTGQARLEVDVQGPLNGEPLLLIMGLGMQLIAWPQALVDDLVSRGFRVIRFDNRDAGLSESFDHLGVPNLIWQTIRYGLRMGVKTPYQLTDMAADALGLLDALGIQTAHIWGVSMGGMIAQLLAAQHPERVKSLCLTMTTSGARRLPQARPEIQAAMVSSPKAGQGFDAACDQWVKMLTLIGSPRYPTPPAALRAQVETSMRRSYRPQGTARQLAAVGAGGDRSPMLGAIIAPTLVIHGEDDPLVPVAAAHDLLAHIDGAQGDLIAGMGHDLPDALLPRFAQAVARNARRAPGVSTLRLDDSAE